MIFRPHRREIILTTLTTAPHTQFTNNMTTAHWLGGKKQDLEPKDRGFKSRLDLIKKNDKKFHKQKWQIKPKPKKKIFLHILAFRFFIFSVSNDGFLNFPDILTFFPLFRNTWPIYKNLSNIFRTCGPKNQYSVINDRIHQFA